MVINAKANGFTHLTCSQWEETMFDSSCNKSQVNVVLGNLMCLHYPREVSRSGAKSSAGTCCVDYGLSPDRRM
jgi:hypothetical protein